MLIGLGSRHFSYLFPHWVHDYFGDVLWALMVYFIVAFVGNRLSCFYVSIIALLFSYGIELSQFCQADWLNALRSYKIGALILGFTFKMSDIICYTIGISVGFLFESIRTVKKIDAFK